MLMFMLKWGWSVRQALCAFGIRTKVEHQAGSTVKFNPHMLSFAVCLFHSPAFQGSLKLDRLNTLNHLCKQVLIKGCPCTALLLHRKYMPYCHLRLSAPF